MLQDCHKYTKKSNKYSRVHKIIPANSPPLDFIRSCVANDHDKQYINTNTNTLKIGSKTSWQKVLGSFLPSALDAVLLNFPASGSKYLEECTPSLDKQLSHSTAKMLFHNKFRDNKSCLSRTEVKQSIENGICVECGP